MGFSLFELTSQTTLLTVGLAQLSELPPPSMERKTATGEEGKNNKNDSNQAAEGLVTCTHAPS